MKHSDLLGLGVPCYLSQSNSTRLGLLIILQIFFGSLVALEKSQNLSDLPMFACQSTLLSNARMRPSDSHGLTLREGGMHSLNKTSARGTCISVEDLALQK